MNDKKLFDAITNISDSYIEETIQYKKPYTYRKWIGVAACILLVFTLGQIFLNKRHTPLMESSGENGFTSGDEKSFMSYDGPILPLCSFSLPENITTTRNSDLDFSPYLTNEHEIIVTDDYTITNHSEKDITFQAYYPFIGNLSDFSDIKPNIYQQDSIFKTSLHIGSYSGNFVGTDGMPNSSYNLDSPHSWEDYQSLLENDAYFSDAFGEAPSLNQEVTVYRFTDLQIEERIGTNPTLNVCFPLNEENSKVLSYGFNGGSWNFRTHYSAKNTSIPDKSHHEYGIPKYLIILGEDISGYSLQSYQDGGCKKGEEIDGVTVSVNRYTTSLEKALMEILQTYNQTKTRDDTKLIGTISEDTHYQLLIDLLIHHSILSEQPKSRYNNCMMEDFFSELEHMERIFYLSFEISIPAGQTISISASMKKECSYNYYCATENKDQVHGYDLLTSAKFAMPFIEQTASIQNYDTIRIVLQNFDFDLENGVDTVSLDSKNQCYFIHVIQSESQH